MVFYFMGNLNRETNRKGKSRVLSLVNRCQMEAQKQHVCSTRVDLLGGLYLFFHFCS